MSTENSTALLHRGLRRHISRNVNSNIGASSRLHEVHRLGPHLATRNIAGVTGRPMMPTLISIETQNLILNAIPQRFMRQDTGMV